MKKYCFTLLATLLLSVQVNAQLNNYTTGDTAPDFTVTDIHGQTHHLSDYEGKWVVIDFYAYWCGPCLAIAQQVNDFYTKYGCNGYDIVMISVEYEGTNEQVELIEQSMGNVNSTPSISGLEGGGAAVHNLYGVAAFPTLVLIGPDGTFKSTDIPLYQSMIVALIEGTITNAGGSAALVPYSCSALGLDETVAEHYSVYPNPATDDAIVKISLPATGSLDVELYSISGTKLSSSKVDAAGQTEIPIELSELAAGTYFVRVISGDTTSPMIPLVKN